METLVFVFDGFRLVSIYWFTGGFHDAGILLMSELACLACHLVSRNTNITLFQKSLRLVDIRCWLQYTRKLTHVKFPTDFLVVSINLVDIYSLVCVCFISSPVGEPTNVKFPPG